MTPLDWPEFAARMACAVTLGSLVGFERQWHQKMAGLKTNALVALGAGGFVLFAAAPGQVNNSQIAAQIVSGIGFLGAGVIMRDGASVHGLNTAATLWCSAMVGALSGYGLYPQAGFAALLVLGTNLALRPIANRLNARVLHRSEIESSYWLTVTAKTDHSQAARTRLQAAVNTLGMAASRVESSNDSGLGQTKILAQVTSPTSRDAEIEQELAKLATEPGVLGTSWRVDRAQPEA